MLLVHERCEHSAGERRSEEVSFLLLLLIASVGRMGNCHRCLADSARAVWPRPLKSFNRPYCNITSNLLYTVQYTAVPGYGYGIFVYSTKSVITLSYIKLLLYFLIRVRV